MSKERAVIARGKEVPCSVRRVPPPEDTPVHFEAEIVSDEEVSRIALLRKDGNKVTDLFRPGLLIEPPLMPGAMINVETFLGFLTAMEEVSSPGASVRIHFCAEGELRLVVEARTHNVWTIAEIPVRDVRSKGFVALMPLRQSVAVLRAVRSYYKEIVVGVDQLGVGLGARSVPFGGRVEKFPAEPVMPICKVRMVMPVQYIRDICERLMTPATYSVMLDFQLAFDGSWVCSALVEDGERVRRLSLPDVIVEALGRDIPRLCLVPARLFRYIAKVDGPEEMSAFEFSRRHLVARGRDFVTIAEISAEGRTAELIRWRDRVK